MADSAGRALESSPVAAAICGGTAVHGAVFFIQRPGGGRTLIRLDVDLMIDPSGRILGAIATFDEWNGDSEKTHQRRFRTLFELAPVSMWEQDFSELKKDVDRLKAEGVSDFRSYIEANPEFVTTCMDKVRLLDINLATVRMLKASEKAELLQSLRTIVTPDAVAVFAEEIIAIAEDRSDFESECTLKALDGSTVYVICRIAFSPEDPSLSEVTVTLTDISERKRSEEERAKLLRTAEMLNELGATISRELDDQKLTQAVTDLATQVTGAQFGAFFHNAVDADGGKYVLYNLSGAPREAFSHFPLPRATAVFAPTFNGESIVLSEDITKDPRYGRSAPYHGMPHGHLPVHSYLAAPVISRAGEVMGGLFFGHEKVGVFTQEHVDVVRGIAAQTSIALDNARLYASSKQDRQKLAQSNNELRRANADLEQFAYSASHDLQEPIRTISVYADLLARNSAGLDQRSMQALQFMSDGAKRMQLLIQGLLAYTQAGNPEESGGEPVDVAAAIANARQSLSNAIDESKAIISVGPMPVIQASRIQLEQVFQNLIGNAIKYARDTGAPVIMISACQSGDCYRFSVADNGIGIAPQYHERIFGIFRRLHGNRKYSGSGIGLAICQRIVERNGGRIWVESTGADAGSTFHFTLPVSREA